MKSELCFTKKTTLKEASRLCVSVLECACCHGLTEI